MLQPADIEKLKMSKPYTDGMKAIQKAKLITTVTLTEFMAARDLLLAKFTIATGSRPGLLNNATLEDYETA